MFTALYQVAKNTFRESLREPIYLLVLLSSLVLVGSFPLCSMYVFRAQERLVVDSSMATMLLFGLGIAVLIASYAISREIDNGTALLLLSKPVQRPVFIVAKILGILGAVTVFWFLLACATLISLRVAVDQFWIDMTLFYLYFLAILLSFAIAGLHNYVTHSSFPMMVVISLCVLLPVLGCYAHFRTANAEEVGLSWYIVPTLLLILFAIWAMATLATALSTRLNLASNLLVCLVLFLLGLTSDYFLGRFTREPWYDTVPSGKQTLWMCHYSFAPTEMDVKRWSMPEKAENSEIFRVWTARGTPTELPVLGSDPAATWRDAEGWSHDAAKVDEQIQFMGEYDAATQQWKVSRVLGEAEAVRKANGKKATVYVFRRSQNPPRTPRGGSWLAPLPSGGSYWATAAYAVVPNWQLFWMADALASHKALPLAYVLYGFAYSVTLVAFLMVLAVRLFGNREIAGRVG